MNQVVEFFKKLFDSSDWPPRWHCGRWTEFHGWLYIISDLLIWSAYFSIPVVIIRYISKRQDVRFIRLYFLFAAFILACGATHFLDAAAFWIPAYRLNALARLITGILSWITVFYLIKYLPVIFSLKPQKDLEREIEQRKRSEEKFKGLLEAAPDAMIIANGNGEIVLINQQSESLFGYKRNELIGKPVGILIHTDFHNKHVDLFNQYFANPEIASIESGLELFVKGKNGSKIPVEISLSPLLTNEGRLISASIRDITDRRNAEEKLRKSEGDFQLLVSSIKDYAIFQIDKNGRIASWNSGAENIKGYNAEEIIGELIDVFYTEEEIQQGKPQANLQMAMQKGHFETEGWRLRKNGSAFYANIVFTSLVDDDGNLYGYAIVTKDITEKTKVEERIRFLASIADNIQDPVISSDSNFIITRWNESAEKLLEWTDEEAIGKPIAEISKPSYPLENKERILESLNEKGFWQGEVIYHTKSGKSLNILSTVSHLKDSGGNVTGNLFLMRDITERRKVEVALNKLNTELEQRVKDRTEEIYNSEKRFRALIENNYDIVFLLDKSFRIFYSSPSAFRLTGWTNEEMENADGKKNIHPDDLQKIDNIVRELMANPGKPVNTLLRTLHKNGNYLWMEGIVINLLQDEHVKAIVFNFRDVTERIKADERIKQTLKELSDYKFALDESSIVAITDQKGIINYVNNNFCKISKYSRAELIRQDHRIINSGYHSKEFIRNLWTTIANGKIWKGELKNKAKDETIYWVDTTIVPFLDDKGKPYQYVAIRADITERKQAEDELAFSEMHFRSLIESSAEGIALTDKFSNVIYRSPAAQKITGILPMENPIGLTHPEDLETIKNIREEVLKKPGIPIEFQGRFLHAGGHYFWMEGTFTNLLHVKEVNAIVANYRDITERKEAEEKLSKSEELYRNLFENMLHGFAYCKAIFDQGRLTDYIYLAVNREYELQTGLKDLTGKKMSEVMPGLLVADPAYARVVTNVVLSGKPAKLETYVEPMNKWLSISLYSPAKEYFVGLIDNITERKQAEQKIKKLNTELEQRVISRTEQLKKTSEEMEAFTYSVSHDLRAPLRGIIGFTTILEEDYTSKLDDEAKRITAVIKGNTLKMGRLIDDLLDFSRMGRLEILKTTVNTKSMVDEIIDELMQQNNGQNKIRWDIRDLLCVNADMNTIRQVWINLISNAIKYSANKEHPCIEIGSYRENEQTIFYVKDNGVGFDEQYKHKLFKVFQRLHSAEEFEGTGVGLALVEKIVSRHGGEVWAKGKENEGACFYFSLPPEKKTIKKAE